EGVVFYAHPSLHQYPWTVEERIKNKHVSKGLKRQAFERFRTELRGGIGVVIERLETQAKQDQWQRGLQQQRPKQLWSHDHSLTPYQVWTVYRMALRQLNMFFEGRQHSNSCRKTSACTQEKETQSHIFWECPCAVACWKWLARHWGGADVTDSGLLGYREYCAARQAPPIPDSLKRRV
ncbi:hypothetical protein PHYSODRAFT_462503, partial [Phytophthora sojae]